MQTTAAVATSSTYTTLEGRVLNLADLSQEQRSFLDRCYAAYRDGVSWEQFTNLVEGVENPLVRAKGGWVTRDVWEHPLYRAVRDLEDRLGIQQGEVGPNAGDDLTSDPISTSSEDG